MCLATFAHIAWNVYIYIFFECEDLNPCLPFSIAARLQALPCIPCEDGAVVTPREALVCTLPALKRLLAPEVVLDLLGKRFVHEDITVLHTSAQLR